MLATVPIAPAPPMIGRAVPVAMLLQAPAAAAIKDNASRETARPVQPGTEARTDPQITFPQLSSLLLGTPPARTDTPQQDAAPPDPSAARPAGMGETVQPGQPAPDGEATGPQQGFADIPTELTREIQKARAALIEQGGGLAAFQQLIQEIAGQTAPRMSFTV